MSQAWATILIAIASILGSAALNLIVVGFYIGRYQGSLADVQEAVKQLRLDSIGSREDIARIKGRMNFKGWNKEN